LIEAQQRLGEMGEEIDLSFSFIAQPGESEIQLGTRATIRNIKSVKTTTSQEQGPYAHGVEFADLDPTKQILLQQWITKLSSPTANGWSSRSLSRSAVWRHTAHTAHPRARPF